MVRLSWAALLFVFATACGNQPDASSRRSPEPSAATTAPSEPPQFGGPVTVRVGDREVTAEVASTPDQRALGLMHRTHLGDDEGMLFLFAAPGSGGFWMKNTLIPLSIAYMAAAEPREGGFPRRYTIGTILDMEPCPPEAASCPAYPPKEPYDAALEVNQGWFADAGISEGAEVVVDGPLPSPSG